MARIERVTPQSVFELFKSLDNDAQRAFVRLLSHFISVEGFFDMLAQLDPLEQKKFTDMVSDELLAHLLPYFARTAIDLVKQSPDANVDELVPLLIAREAERQKLHDEELSKLAEAKLKGQRDRKSDPGVIRRNVEICDLKRANAKLWSHRRLGKKYELSPQAISLILKEEAKWRQMAGGVK